MQQKKKKKIINEKPQQILSAKGIEIFQTLFQQVPQAKQEEAE